MDNGQFIDDLPIKSGNLYVVFRIWNGVNHLWRGWQRKILHVFLNIRRSQLSMKNGVNSARLDKNTAGIWWETDFPNLLTLSGSMWVLRLVMRFKRWSWTLSDFRRGPLWSPSTLIRCGCFRTVSGSPRGFEPMILVASRDQSRWITIKSD